jgi:hypothetical protein
MLKQEGNPNGFIQGMREGETTFPDKAFFNNQNPVTWYMEKRRFQDLYFNIGV